jgi:hypothetical protein
MEDILDVYCRPYDPMRPVICMDEQPRQLLRETRAPEPLAPGRPERYDFEYARNGTANLFLFAEPLGSWRKVNVRQCRTSIDWAQEIRELLHQDYPDVEKVVLVCDNLNTHKVGSLYEAFPPNEARGLAQRLEIHYTPKHGSWLNIAEIELSALTQQCLGKRIPSIETLRCHTRLWAQNRNTRQRGVNWRFTTEDARIKLKRLYPQVQMS